MADVREDPYINYAMFGTFTLNWEEEVISVEKVRNVNTGEETRYWKIITKQANTDIYDLYNYRTCNCRLRTQGRIKMLFDPVDRCFLDESNFLMYVTPETAQKIVVDIQSFRRLFPGGRERVGRHAEDLDDMPPEFRDNIIRLPNGEIRRVVPNDVAYGRNVPRQENSNVDRPEGVVDDPLEPSPFAGGATTNMKKTKKTRSLKRTNSPKRSPRARKTLKV
jgi:hypothetical protein